MGLNENTVHCGAPTVQLTPLVKLATIVTKVLLDFFFSQPSFCTALVLEWTLHINSTLLVRVMPALPFPWLSRWASG